MGNLEIPEFKIRCSAIGKIMTEPKQKSAVLSKTCMSYLESWANEYVYGRKVEFTSKYTTKGNQVEDDAIVYASGHVKSMGLSSKNTKRFRNEWMEGEPDVISEDTVHDIKSSWSHDTFPIYSPDLPETDYAWQVLGYMALTEKQKGKVVFALMSMPEEMIEREARWKLGAEFTKAEYENFAEQFRYDGLPAYLRIKEYEIEYNIEKIEAIKKRVSECRLYINNTIIPALENNAKRYD